MDNEKNSHEKELWLGEFFNYIFLEEGAIFTLWQSKPLTTIPLYLFSYEEILELYNQLTDEQKSQVTIVDNYDLSSNWKNWEKFQEGLDIKRFEFFLREDPRNPKAPDLWFINKEQITLAIEDHYEIFSKALQFDFESDQVVSEIKDPHSTFWNKVVEEPLLLGILHGFGKHNSQCFDRKHVENGPIEDALSFTFSDTTKMGSASLEKFPLPIFASFTKDDPIIAKYKEERQMIKNRYKGKEFIQLTLEKLQE